MFHGRVPALAENPVDHHVEQRDKENGQEGGGEHPTQYAGTDGFLGTGAGTGCHGQRQHPETECQRGHHDGP